MERSVIDGGVRDGRPESAHASGLITLAVILIPVVLVLGLAFKWIVYGFP
jgi:hypothetical protein